MNWQLIGSAPKDGRFILGFADGDWAVVYWHVDCWTLSVVGAYAADGQWWPTHWMPLPEPPDA